MKEKKPQYCFTLNDNIRFLEIAHRENAHSIYFYPDYINYQPDFAQKLHTVLDWLTENGYTSCFLEEAVSHIFPYT